MNRLLQAGLILACAHLPQLAQTRKALVMGNDAYLRRPLKNPLNDATDFAAALRRIGFDATVVTNANMIREKAAVRDFFATVNPGDEVVFYFSGHGMEIDGQNFLLPTDFDASDPETAKTQALVADAVRAQAQIKKVSVAIIILDACRNNPYKGWSRSEDRGLATMTGAKGTYIAFAAAPGMTADDNPNERNGLFTKYLLQYISTPNLSIDQVFSRIRKAVNDEKKEAVPFSVSGLIGDYYFSRPGTIPPRPIRPVVPGFPGLTVASTIELPAEFPKGTFFMSFEKDPGITRQKLLAFPSLSAMIEHFQSDADWFKGLMSMTAITAAEGGRPVVVLSQQIGGSGAQSYRCTAPFPTDWVKSKWNENFRITNVSAVLDKSCVVMTQNTGIAQQHLEGPVAEWPAADVRQQYDRKDYHMVISDFAHNDAGWVVVTSSAASTVSQRWADKWDKQAVDAAIAAGSNSVRSARAGSWRTVETLSPYQSTWLFTEEPKSSEIERLEREGYRIKWLW
jgi:hypothetical protein